MVVPEDMVRQVEKLAQNIFICPSTLAQRAALAAFEPDTQATLEERRLELRHRRDFLIPALKDLGFRIPIVPDGAFYIYTGCERFSSDSAQFALDILENAAVAVTSGIDFGVHRAGSHLRFSYTRKIGDLEEGIERLRRYLAR